jgi:iron complex outermembrane receptor protein
MAKLINHRHWRWAQAGDYSIERCGGRTKIIASVEDSTTIHRIVEHLECHAARNTGISRPGVAGLASAEKRAYSSYPRFGAVIVRCVNITEFSLPRQSATGGRKLKGARPLGKEGMMKHCARERCRFAAHLIAMGIGALASLRLFAQESPPAGADVLQEVVVTAQKRSEDVQKVPIAISVLSGADVSAAGAVYAVDLNALVPGLQIVSSGPFAMASIRGIGTQQVNSYGDPAVGYNVDGVVEDRSIDTTTAFYDVQRIEVLKGPQGTLYGRNATGGAINIITNKPTDTLGAGLQLDVGDYSTHNATGWVNVPLTSTLASRIAFQTVNHQGYFTDGYNDADDVAARIEFLYTPSHAVSLLLSVDGLHQGGKGPEDEPLPAGSDRQNPSNPWDQHYYGNPGAYYGVFSGQFLQTPWTIQPFVDNKFWGSHLQLDWDLGFATLTVIPAYRTTHQLMDFHYAGVWEYVDNPTRQTTGEIRLGHAGEPTRGALSWVAGLYYFRLDQSVNAAYGSIACLCADDASPTYVQSVNDAGRALTDLNSRSYAGFAQATYSVNDRLRATLGGRYTHDKKTEDGNGFVHLYSIGADVPYTDVGEATWNNFSWKVGLEADATRDSMLYANVSTGYKAGGLNEGLFSAPYRPEELTAFALGSKNRLLETRVLLNSEIFYWDYRDHQVATVAAVNPPPTLGYVGINIPRSQIYGTDLDLTALVTESDRVELSAEYLDGHTGPYVVPTVVSGVNYSANEAPMISAPHWDLTGSLTHDWRVSGGGTVSWEARVHYTTKQLLYPIVVPDAFAPAATIADLNLTFHSSNDAWFVGAYVKNVGNTLTVLSVFPGPLPRDVFSAIPGDARQYGFIGPPRTFGVRIGARL